MRISDWSSDVCSSDLPKPVPGGDSALLAALARPAGIQDDRLAAGDADFSQLPKIGTPGAIVSQTALPGLRAERLEFANGVTALVSNNQVEPGKVRINVRFGTGNRSVGAEEPNLLWTGAYALVASGIGPWGQSGIDQMTNRS